MAYITEPKRPFPGLGTSILDIGTTAVDFIPGGSVVKDVGSAISSIIGIKPSSGSVAQMVAPEIKQAADEGNLMAINFLYFKVTYHIGVQSEIDVWTPIFRDIQLNHPEWVKESLQKINAPAHFWEVSPQTALQRIQANTLEATGNSNPPVNQSNQFPGTGAPVQAGVLGGLTSSPMLLVGLGLAAFLAFQSGGKRRRRR